MAQIPPPPSPSGRPPPPSPGARWGGAGQRVMAGQRSARNMGFGGGGGGGGGRMPPPPSPGGGRGGGGYATQMTSDEEKQNQQLQNERRYLAQTRSGIRRFSAVSSPHLHGGGGGGGDDSDEDQEYDQYGNPIVDQEGIHKEPITLQQSLHDMHNEVKAHAKRIKQKQAETDSMQFDGDGNVIHHEDSFGADSPRRSDPPQFNQNGELEQTISDSLTHQDVNLPPTVSDQNEIPAIWVKSKTWSKRPFSFQYSRPGQSPGVNLRVGDTFSLYINHTNRKAAYAEAGHDTQGEKLTR